MAVMVKTLTDQNKAMMEIMKTLSDKSETPGPSNFAKMTSRNTATKFNSKVTKFNGSYFKVARFDRPLGIVGLRRHLYRKQ